MKNIIFLTMTLSLGLSLIGCGESKSGGGKGGSDRVGALNVLNQTDFGLGVYQGSEQVLELKTGECVNLTQEQLLKLSLRKVTAIFDLSLDDIFCSNDVTPGTSAKATAKCNLGAQTVYAANTQGELELMDYQAPAEGEPVDFSKCKSLEVKDDAEEGDEEGDTDEGNTAS